ncbi:MAG: ABC transporter ATP-binding protein [Egibacteraceae bacterium]
MLLSVEGLTKTYRPPGPVLRPLVRTASRTPVTALADVDLRVGAGEVVGLIGPNGAGKTTLIRVVAGLLEPSSGRVRIDGHDITRETAQAQRRLGLVLEGDRGLYPRLTGVANLELFGVLAGLPPPVARRRACELLDLVDLAGRDKLVFGYSAGMRARLCMARALLADPALLVLDEPTRSLDPVASAFVSRMLKELARQGHGVLLCNHRMDEIAAVCGRVVGLVGGRLRFDTPMAELAHSQRSIAVTLAARLEQEAGP